MDFYENLRKYFPTTYILFREVEYNLTIDIETRFEKECIVIPSGHGGDGFDLRKIISYAEKNQYLRLCNPSKPDYHSLMSLTRWPAEIIFPERIAGVLELAYSLLQFPENAREHSLLDLYHKIKWFKK